MPHDEVPEAEAHKQPKTQRQPYRLRWWCTACCAVLVSAVWWPMMGPPWGGGSLLLSAACGCSMVQHHFRRRLLLSRHAVVLQIAAPVFVPCPFLDAYELDDVERHFNELCRALNGELSISHHRWGLKRDEPSQTLRPPQTPPSLQLHCIHRHQPLKHSTGPLSPVFPTQLLSTRIVSKVFALQKWGRSSAQARPAWSMTSMRLLPT